MNKSKSTAKRNARIYALNTKSVNPVSKNKLSKKFKVTRTRIQQIIKAEMKKRGLV